MTKEKPILFSTEMVRAIINGKKTATRRFANTNTPPYNVGDVLYVRETWAKTTDGNYIFKADPIFRYMRSGDFSFSWCPSIHLPKKASRILLEVIKIHKEKLQNITEEDAKKEGVKKQCSNTFREAFKNLWNKLNAKKINASWNNNPYVWVIEFKIKKIKE